MSIFTEVWTRPGAASFGRVIDGVPWVSHSFHDGLNIVGDGSGRIPSSFTRFDEILYLDAATPANCVSSLVRVYDDSDPTTPIHEWLPRLILPPESKSDLNVDVSGRGIKSIIEYARCEAWDWDGSVLFASKFPDWIYGGTNILGNQGFEDAAPQPIIYTLAIDASAGTFTLSDGSDTTSAIAYNAADGTIELRLETDIAAIDDVNVSPLGGVPTGYELQITATSGTFTISGPSDTTAPLDPGISAASLETAIEGLTGVTDVTVTAITGGFQIDCVNPTSVALSIDTTNLSGGSASLSVSNTGNGFEIAFVNPATGITLTIGTGSLTGSASLVLTQAGEYLPAVWTKSQQISTGTPREFGIYDTFELSTTQAHSGTYSLKIDPGTVTARIDAFAGTQQIVAVDEGGLYQASVWVYPTSSGQTYRLVIRGLDEDFIAATNVSPPANTWTQVVVSDITIPDGDSRVIFRFANTNLSGNPAAFYVDDAEFREGQAAATIGKILGDLYDDATSDHAGRVVWEDLSNPGNPYLTLDFSDTVDSNGVAWFDEEIEIKLWMRMTYLQVMDQFADTYGYEWRIVPDDVEAGTWLWQVYNPGTMKTDYTSAQTPAIQGGSQDIRRQLLRVLPDATDSLVEGLERFTARYDMADLEAAIGRIEKSRIDKELPQLTPLGEAAYEDALEALTRGLSYTYNLVDPPDVPLVAYLVGDLLTVHDPPEVDDDARCVDVYAVVDSESTEFEVQFIPATASGS